MPDDAKEREHWSRQSIAGIVIQAIVASRSGKGMALPAGRAADEILTLLAPAFASQQAKEGWERDFSGAPFDGTPILAAFGPATGNRVDIVFWQDGPKPYWRSAIMERVHGARYMRANQPIAWQHKPAPPAMLDAAPSVTSPPANQSR